MRETGFTISFISFLKDWTLLADDDQQCTYVGMWRLLAAISSWGRLKYEINFGDKSFFLLRLLLLAVVAVLCFIVIIRQVGRTWWWMQNHTTNFYWTFSVGAQSYFDDEVICRSIPFRGRVVSCRVPPFRVPTRGRLHAHTHTHMFIYLLYAISRAIIVKTRSQPCTALHCYVSPY